MLLMSLLRNSLELGCLRSTAEPKSKTINPLSVLKILYSENHHELILLYDIDL